MDSSVATGAGLTGLSSSSSGLIISTIMEAEATATTYTQAGSTIETITTLGTFAAPTATKCRFEEVDATNHKGVYEIQIADARFSGTGQLLVSISGATNLAQADFIVDMSGTNTTQINGTAQTARDIGASVLLSSGTGTGQVSLSSGTVTAGTVSDKTGYALSGAGVTAVQTGLATPTNITAGTITTTTSVTNPVTAGTVSDKTGYSLSATGADLILGASTFVTNLVTACWAYATRTLSAFGFTPAISGTVTLASGTHTGAVIPTVTTVTNAPADMAKDSTVAKDATVSKPGTAQTISSNSDISAIKAQTDKMAFTVANRIDANALQVGDKTGYSGTATNMVPDVSSILGAPAGTSVSADIAAIKIDTSTVKTLTQASGAGDLANIKTNAQTAAAFAGNAGTMIEVIS
jgi:hypothetical protein